MFEDPPLLADDDDVDASETDLMLHRPLREIEEPRRSAVRGWLVEHQIDPDRVAVGAPVERHESSSSVAWREENDQGLVVRRLFPAVAAADRWPAPFPDEVLSSTA